MRNLTIAIMALLSVGMPACSSSTGPKTTIDGTWQGAAGGQTVSINLTSAAQAVSGTGTISGGGSASYSVTVSGTYLVPNVALTLTSTGHPSISLIATFGGNSMAGSLNGGGFADAVIVLNRQ